MFVIEMEGYNDGVPYEEYRTAVKSAALDKLAILRAENTKVRFRLIQIIEDYD